MLNSIFELSECDITCLEIINEDLEPIMIPCNENHNYYSYDLENKENETPERATILEIGNDNLEPIVICNSGGRSNCSDMLYPDNEEKQAPFSKRNTVLTGNSFINWF